MELLNRIIAYWYDCVKNEDILAKDISINVRKKAVLYPFDKDPFIFERDDIPVKIFNDERLNRFAEYTALRGYEVFYGYPILYYYNDDLGKNLIAPLFVIKVNFIRQGRKLHLQREESIPSCGIQAFYKLGFKTEEVADLNQTIQSLFRTGLSGKITLLRKCLSIIQNEVELPIREFLNPDKLTNSVKLSKSSAPGIYNKSVLFAGDDTWYNIYLLQDLSELKTKSDLYKTALSYIFEKNQTVKKKNKKIPVLPFPANEYQIKAIQEVFNSKITVITGPPGTGKSQFIANLLVNLFLDGKTVLFVSHTNEAVDVVNKKINEKFRNLILRTGKKEFRQELKAQFNELIMESEKKPVRKINYGRIKMLWREIIDYRSNLEKLLSMEQRFEELFQQIKDKRRKNSNRDFLSMYVTKLRTLIPNIKLQLIKYRLDHGPSKRDIENRIKMLEDKFFELSEAYVKSVYIERILGKELKIGNVNAFLQEVSTSKFKRHSINYPQFLNALRILRVWSSTLKSIRRTFPLAPAIFDFVIFDEASQVDLPSAAPALYRAKKAIVVGDPMQLSHVSVVTRDLDRKLAQIHGLIGDKELYPYKIRYYDISLYKSAENSLNHKPLILIKHYRSEDQIIELCNRVFYKGQLKIMSLLDYTNWPEDLPLGVQWIDCEGEVYKHPAGSRINPREVSVVVGLFRDIIKKINGTNLTVGVVTPYTRQEKAISDQIQKIISPEILEKHKVKVLTAHKFQGTEKDIMIFSLVLASKGNGNSDRWYNIYPQILNVALSRARYLLYIVGDKKFCYNHKCFKGEQCILKRIVRTYDEIKKLERTEESIIKGKFDSLAEKLLYKKLLEINIQKYGYRLIPKLVVKRYTLDLALVGKHKIDIECDGHQHEIIEGIPVIEDLVRDDFLQKQGWKVLRFPNHKILSGIDDVIKEILKIL